MKIYGNVLLQLRQSFEQNAPVYPCPTCGKNNSFSIDLISFIESAVASLSKLSIEELVNLQSTLKGLLSPGITINHFHQAQSEVEKAVPEFKWLDIFKPKNSEQAYMLLAIIVGAIFSTLTLLQGANDDDKEKKLPTQEQVIEQTKQYALPPSKDTVFIEKPATKTAPSKTKPGRNVLCPCGSGIKFKNCHGKE